MSLRKRISCCPDKIQNRVSTGLDFEFHVVDKPHKFHENDFFLFKTYYVVYASVFDIIGKEVRY